VGERRASFFSTAQINKTPRSRDGASYVNQYKIIKTLGQGSFAKVKMVQDIETQEYYAMKQINKKVLKSKEIYNGQNAYMCIMEELKVLKTLEHPNVIYLHEIIDDPDKDHLFIIT